MAEWVQEVSRAEEEIGGLSVQQRHLKRGWIPILKEFRVEFRQTRERIVGIMKKLKISYWMKIKENFKKIIIEWMNE